VHGWLVDPANREEYDAISRVSKNRDCVSVHKLLTDMGLLTDGVLDTHAAQAGPSGPNTNLTEEEKKKYNDGEYSEPCALCGHLPMRQAQAVTILRFLKRSSSQLTPQGRKCLLSFSAQQKAPSSASPSPSPAPSRTAADSELNAPPHLELFAFVRHWHIEVLCRHANHNDSELYTLVTNHRFLEDPKVVWERLADTNQHTAEYFDSTFQRIELGTAGPREYVPHVLPILY
jgi:hypothetical protein